MSDLIKKLESIEHEISSAISDLRYIQMNLKDLLENTKRGPDPEVIQEEDRSEKIREALRIKTEERKRLRGTSV
jgi:FtsZ-binding cell division protein ZapB